MNSVINKTLTINMNGPAAIFGHFLLRVAAGVMIFYIHGIHKLEGWIAYVQHGTSWELLEEVSGMHFPAPYAILKQ